MSSRRWLLIACALGLVCGACGDDDGASADAGDVVDGGPPADADPGPHPGEVWMLAWNIQTFPKATTTIAKVTTILAERPIDIVGVEEIDNVAAFTTLDDGLSAYTGIVSMDVTQDTHVGLLYRHSTVTIDSVETILDNDNFAFPRPPLKVHATCQGVDFTVIVVHLKALGDDESVARRKDAIIKLKAWMDAERARPGADQDIVVLGDWNDLLTDTGTDNVFAPLLADTATYRFLTLPLAETVQQNGGTYIPFESFIDHVMMTTDAEAEYGAGETLVLKLDQADDSYQSQVSDHRPVLVKFKPGAP